MTKITIEELIRNPRPTLQDMEQNKIVHYRREANYNAGGKFFMSIFEIIKKRENKPEEDIWAIIVAAMIETSFKLSTSLQPDTPENERISIFMKEILKKLEIPIEQARQVYNLINQRNQ